MTLNQLLKTLWKDYGQLNPSAVRVHDILTRRGETVLNDHVALRTYDDKKIDLHQMAKVFIKHGYVAKGEYVFVEKKLFALHFEHQDLNLPKIFISHLESSKLSTSSQKIISSLVAQVPEGSNERPDFCVSGRPWKVTHKEYSQLLEESEYAAWMAAFGFRVNHFTVNVNALKGFKDLQSLNEFIKAQGYKLNASGGEIKGSKAVYLEQSSTLADKVKVKFEDGTFEIPSVYYEFALRYPLADGKLYQGFVEKSADKIFESTDAKQQK
jgi:hypothetical protein